MKSNLFIALILLPLIVRGQIITTVAGNGTAGYSGDGGLATNAELNQPGGVCFDQAGNLYIADWQNSVVRKVSTSGIITTVVGNGVSGYSGDGGPASSAELSEPVAISFDENGNMYITDGNNVIRKVSTLGIITTFAGSGPIGYNGDNIPATAAELNSPAGTVFDNEGNFYIADEGNYRVRKVSREGVITTIAGTGVRGYSGDGGPATAAQLRLPTWVAFSPSGELFITDMGDKHVRKINNAGIISTVAGNGSFPSGDGGLATVAGIGECNGIVFDNEGNYYITNEGDCSIREINVAGIITTICGDDSCGYSGDGGPATAANISNLSWGPSINNSGNLCFADNLNNRVRKITYHPEAVTNIPNTPQNITIYPNPTRNEITITAPDKIETITITSMLGEALETSLISMRDKESILNVTSLPAGVYFVRVNNVYAGEFVKE